MSRSRLPLAAFLTANAISITGNRITQLAIPWFVLQTTGSVAKTGLAGFFTLLPVVISSALGGVIVDRLGLRRASVVSDVASGLSVLLVPVLFHTVGLPFAALLAVVLPGRSWMRPAAPGLRPSGVLSTHGSFLYVLHEGHTVTVVDSRTGTVLTDGVRATTLLSAQN